MILKFFLIACLVAEIYSDDRKVLKPILGLKPSKKIIGGKDAHPGHFPFLVSIQLRVAVDRGYTDIHHCGGAIIDARWILTAAHCLKHGHTLIIKAGKYDITKIEAHEQVVLAKKLIGSQGYHKDHEHNDIGLILLATPLTFNKYVGKIDLPPKDSEPTGFATLPGWGSTSPVIGSPMSPILKAVTMHIIDRKTCEHQNDKFHHKNKIINSQICSNGSPHGGAGGCAGDSGGPFIAKKEGGRKEIVGIYSWSYDPCGGVEVPDVYTKVSSYILWIHTTMEHHKHD